MAQIERAKMMYKRKSVTEPAIIVVSCVFVSQRLCVGRMIAEAHAKPEAMMIRSLVTWFSYVKG